MAETYCGKSCMECTQKETLQCPGCRVGPGRELGGDCELARCVREKGHETCDTCLNKGRCGTFQGKENMAFYRRRKQEAKEAEQRKLAARVPVLGKWLSYLFWLVVPSVVSSLLTIEMVAEAFPWLSVFGSLLGTACSLAYGLILVRLGSEAEGYRTAGICVLIAGAVNYLASFLSGNWTLLMTLPAAVLALYGEYREYMAHSSVLAGVDNELSGKWEKLWVWHIGSFAAILIGAVLAFIPVLALIVMLGGLLAMCVVSFLKLKYLHQTAKLFREYPAPV